MAGLSTVILVIGWIVAILGGLALLVAAFKESVFWGLLCIFVSPTMIVFVVLHWDDAKGPFLVQLAGMGLIILSVIVGAGAA